MTQEGLKYVYKGFNLYGDELAARLRAFKRAGVHVLGSFIFGLPSDRASTFDATLALANAADITFAQFVLLTPFPGTIDYEKWVKENEATAMRVDDIPITTHWLIPESRRPKMCIAHPTMAEQEIRARTQQVWDRFYSLRAVWARSRVLQSLKSRLAFVLISKLYRSMYANTGISTDSARVKRSTRSARWLAAVARRLFVAAPMPDLAMPGQPLNVAVLE